MKYKREKTYQGIWKWKTIMDKFILYQESWIIETGKKGSLIKEKKPWTMKNEKQVRNLCVYSRPGDRVWP